MQRKLLVVVVAAVLSGCGADRALAPQPGPPASIRKLQGDFQRADPGATLDLRLTIQVTDAVGVPVAGVPIRWSFTEGNGLLEPSSGKTDIAGKASTTVNYARIVPPTLGVRVEAAVEPPLSTDFLLFAGAAGPIIPPTPAANISVGDNFFSPQSVTIPAGRTVLWTLVGSNPHFVYVTGGEPHVRILSGNPNITGDGTFIAQFDEAGEYQYYCAYHFSEQMGWVHVR
ncbi:MAG TPA: Ig-like domain-containing protein [Gemmatimonadales bacterium]